MKNKTTALALAALIGSAAMPALAQSAGDFTIGLGVGAVMPKDDNGTLTAGDLKIGDSVRPTFTFEYFIRDNLGIEVLAALPFKHSLSIDGIGQVGSGTHLPPTVSLNYHFPTGGKITPLLGIGVNYTAFIEDKATGPLAGNDLDVGSSVGLALHAGLDYAVSDKGAIRADLRWIDINSDVKLNGTKIGEAQIDPLVVGVSYVMKF